MEPQLVLDDETVRVEKLVGDDSSTLVFTCTGVGHASGGTDVQRPEFIKTACKRGSVVTIIDKQRSWGNSIDFSAVSRAVRHEIDAASRVLCVGNSMGAFNAVILTRFVRADACIAFAPQFSVHPQVVPNEKRWQSYTSQISNYKYKSLNDQFVSGVQYYVFSGNEIREREHWSKMPQAAHIKNIVVRRCGHEVGRRLKELGLLNSVFGEAIEGGSGVVELLRKSGVECVDLNSEKMPRHFKADLVRQRLRQLIRSSAHT